MRCFLISNVLCAAALVFLPPLSPAQTSTPSDSCPCALRGTVVNSVSGQPINRALVRLTGNSRAALTDAEGRFQFDGLPAGSVTVLAEKPGFLGRDSNGTPPPSIQSFRVAPQAPAVMLKLIPESILYGQVADENGQPLEGFTVAVFLRNPGERHANLDRRHRALTDDEGKFRIAGLHPGTYFLQVTETQAPVLNSSRKFAAPAGYSPAFYPAVNDMASATPVKLLPGKAVQADFSLKREPYVQLSGTVSGFHPQERIFLSLLDSSGNPSEIAFDPVSGSFHTKWIPPGAYTLIAQAAGLHPATKEEMRDVSFASQRINAASSVSGLRLALQPTVDIPIVIRNLAGANSEDLQSLPLALGLISKENGTAGFTRSASVVSPEGSPSSGDTRLFFAGVVPGTYELVTESPSGTSLYSESAIWGSIDLLHSDLVLESSGSIPPIEVVVRDDGASLSGSVSAEDTAIPAQVVLLGERLRKPQTVSISSNGRFEISGLAPGTYRVFAVDSTSNVDYADPSFLQKISTKIQELTLSPKQSASVDLEVATVEE